MKDKTTIVEKTDNSQQSLVSKKEYGIMQNSNELIK